MEDHSCSTSMIQYSDTVTAEMKSLLSFLYCFCKFLSTSPAMMPAEIK